MANDKLKVKIDVVANTDIVELRCNNFMCFNNRHVFGENTCNLKNMMIGNNGRCEYEVKRDDKNKKG